MLIVYAYFFRHLSLSMLISFMLTKKECISLHTDSREDIIIRRINVKEISFVLDFSNCLTNKVNMASKISCHLL